MHGDHTVRTETMNMACGMKTWCARVAATEAEECVWVLDPCPQVEGANYDWFVLAAGRGERLWIEGRCVGSAARAGLAGREIRFSDNEAR